MARVRFKNQLLRMHNIEIKGIGVVIEELKQSINAKLHRIKRYSHRITEFWQNRLFDTNQIQFYNELYDQKGSEHRIPDATEVREFGVTCGTNRWSTAGM